MLRALSNRVPLTGETHGAKWPDKLWYNTQVERRESRARVRFNILARSERVKAIKLYCVS